MGTHIRSLLIALVFLTGCEIFKSEVRAQLISATTRKDHVFDPVSRTLYITTSSATVLRYSVDTQSFLSSWSLGGTLGGINVTPDGSTVLVADSTYDTNTDLGVVRRVNASTGVATTLSFPLYGGQTSFTETGAWDVLALSNSKAYFTTDFVGTAQVSLYEWNLQSDQITKRRGLYERGMLYRSQDLKSMLVVEGSISPASVHRYDAPTDTFRSASPILSDLNNAAAAISRDGQWIAIERDNSVADETRIFTKNVGGNGIVLQNITGGLFFHPSADVLYGVDAVTDDVVAYDTNTWTEINRTHVATNLLASTVFSSGETSFDSQTNSLYLSVTSGIYKVSLPAPPTPPHPLDYSRNGTIGDEDYAAWRAHYGDISGIGDGDRDGQVTPADFVVLRKRLSTGFGGTSATVPEPASFTGSAFVALWLTCRRPARRTT